MARPIETLSIQLKFKDAGSQAVIEKVKGSLKQLQLGASGATPKIKGLRDQILAQGRASINSVSNINAQRSALAALRDEARIGGKNFKQLTEDIKKLDAQLGKTSKKSPNVGARQATQIAGAVVSGGIFGGPEGAIGALGGAAFGGVEGAFAGAAIGAQFKALRDLTASAANYAADIEKLQIALKGVAGSQADYNSAIQAAQDATERFNVPQRDAIRGVTRLTAAVKGAGGPIEDAETTFKNVTAAIKATGGSTEDVRGAITAMVQVFSKGKVSAEELSGQLGERLPGAVTKFAEANDMTLPELQKNLKAGTVGLNELMNFIRELGDTYGETAEQIADSNAEAGARLTVVIENMQADVGKALVPIGAQFQAAFADFITNITPTLVDIVPKIAKGFLTLAKNLDTLLVAATAAFAVFAPVKLAAIIAKIGGISAAVEILKGKLVEAGLANPFTALAVGAGVLAGVIFTASKEQKRFNDLLKEGSVIEVNEELRKLEKARDEALKKLVAAKKKAGVSDDFDNKKTGSSYDFELISGFEAEQLAFNRLDRQVKALEKKRAQITDTDPTQGAALQSYNFTRFDYGQITPDGGGTASTIKDISDAELKASLAQLDAKNRINTLDEESVRLKRAQFVAQRDAAIAAAKAANAAKGGLEPNREELAIKKARVTFANQNLQLDKQIQTQAEKALQIKKQDDALILRGRLMAGEITQEQFDQEQKLQSISKLLELQPELYEKIKKKLEEVSTPLKTFRDGVKKIFEEAMNLKDALAVRGVEAVRQFGDAFADFVATGKASFKELTVSILQDLARIFARAALFKTLSLIPGVGNFLGFKDGGVVKGMTPPTTMPDSVSLMAANGMAFAKNKIVPYAKGGIVNKPTLFQYASGGTGRFGLMGEAGAEAILPLRRGANGKLGVEASGTTSNVVVNVDASGSSVQGNQPNAKALGQAIGTAVQAELVKQKRPGGLLS